MKEVFDVSVDGFSGPLDLLCHLVESRQMQASRIKVTQLVRLYGVWLANTKRASVEAIAEFFFMAAGLLLQKAKSLLPEAAVEYEEIDDALPVSEEEFLETLARYRPYRNATSWLQARRKDEERSFRRILNKEDVLAEEPEYDLGDLYFLARVWWGLFERYSKSKLISRADISFFDEEEAWDGLPGALPDEDQIQSRIEELECRLKISSMLSLRELWLLAPSVKLLVVTLLAILEMCRMGKVSIEQETLFSDVKIKYEV